MRPRLRRVTCSDVNECDLGTDNCGLHATCMQCEDPPAADCSCAHPSSGPCKVVFNGVCFELGRWRRVPCRRPAPKRYPDLVPTSGKPMRRGSGVQPKKASKGREVQREQQQPRAKLGKTPSLQNFMGPSSDQHD